MVLSSFVPVWASADITTLKNRLVPDIVENEQKNAQNKYNTGLALLAAGYFNTQLSNGRWTDINYQDTSRSVWDPSEHLIRLRLMSVDHHLTPTSNKLNQLLAGINYWYQVNPVSDNWWWNTIGKQKYLGPIGLLLDGQLSTQQLNSILADLPAQPSMTGANRTDISQSVIHRGLLANDESLVQNGINGIGASIVHTTGDGIQADYSYHEHGPLLHNGSYGKVLLGSALYWVYQVRDLQWAYPQQKRNIITSYFLDGDRWMTRHHQIDYSTGGRSVSRPALENIDTSRLIKQIAMTEALVPHRDAETQAFAEHVDCDLSDSATCNPSGLNAHKHFWRSDYSVNARPDYLFTVNMSSNRVHTSETGNGENLLGFWLGLGNTFLYQHGQEYRDIFPVWDWTKLPGITGPEYDGPSRTWGDPLLHTAGFVGGVSNGKAGISTMRLNILDTQANKAWFHFEQVIVALGSDIQSGHNNNVYTTVAQNLLSGDVTVDGNIQSGNESHLTDSNWVHHHNVGYIFPDNWNGTVSLQNQSGSWKSINNSQSDELISKDVFKLYIDHGYQPQDDSYAYYILPAATKTDTQSFANNPGVSILANSADIQAVQHVQTQQTGVIFHQAGSLTLPSGHTLSVTRPSALMLDQSDGAVAIVAATPGAGGFDLGVCWTDNNNATQKALVAMPGASTTLGSSQAVSFDGSNGECSPNQSLVASDDAFVRDGAHADSNYGTSSYLAIKQSGNGYNRKAILQWDLNQLGVSSVEHAELRLHVRNTDSATTLKLYKTGDNWGETTLSWNNAPTSGWHFAQLQVSGSDQWLTLDITAFVNAELAGDKHLSFVIEGSDAEIYTAIDSKEHIDKPQISISY